MFRKAMGGLLASFAAADINDDFKSILHGGEQLHAGDLEPLWTQFKTEFASLSPVALDEDSMFTFFENVDSIIEHNRKSDKTFTRGINKFSAMNFEQFSEHFHLSENQKNAEQNCSATRSSPLTEANLDAEIPDTWNWQDHGGVSPVKD